MKSRKQLRVSTMTKKRVMSTTEHKTESISFDCLVQTRLVMPGQTNDLDNGDKVPSPGKKVDPHSANPPGKTNNKNMESEVYKFRTMELLSLYVTMSLKQMVNNKLSPRKPLADLAKVVEDNLKTMKVERQWFLATLRDHARIYHHEWMSNYEKNPTRSLLAPHFNTKRKDKGLVQYNTLLLVLSLRLGLERPWVAEGHTEFQIDTLEEELLSLCSPSMPALELKYLSQCCPIFDFLFKHSRRLETINLPRSNSDIFLLSCQKYKTLRVIEFDDNVPDQEICHALWNVAKSSKEVLHMALKGDSKFTINLPYLEVLRSNILRGTGKWSLSLPVLGTYQEAIDLCQMFMPKEQKFMNINPKSTQQETMQLSLGAAALLLQPFMNVVENESIWDTMSAVRYLLRMESEQKSGNALHLGLRNLTLLSETEVDLKQMRSLVKVCPAVDTLTLPETPIPDTQFKAIMEYVPMKNLKHLDLDTMRLAGEDLLQLLTRTPNLEKLTLHLSDENLTCIQFIATSELSKKVLTELQASPRLQTLALEFETMFYDLDDNKAMEMLLFLSCFPTVTTLTLNQTIFIPPKYLMYGCLSGALTSMLRLQHLSLVSCDMNLPHDLPAFAKVHQPELYDHFPKVIFLLPMFLDDERFKTLYGLKTFEVDEMYLAPRVDCLLEALRNNGVSVSIKYRASPIRSSGGPSSK